MSSEKSSVPPASQLQKLFLIYKPRQSKQITDDDLRSPILLVVCELSEDSMLPMAGRLDLIRVVPTLMRILGISRGHILYNATNGLGQLL